MREKLKAKSLLARMRVQEPLVQGWEERAATATKDAEFWRERFAATYRRIVGVHPYRRAELRSELEELSKFGDIAVAEVVARIDRQPTHSKGDSSAAAVVGGNAMPPLASVADADNPFD